MSLRRRCALRLLLFFLCLLQPLARLWGRASGGLTPWRRRGPVLLRLPRRRTVSVWSEVWRSPADWVARLQSTLNPRATWCRRGGDFDTWDLETRTGGLAAGRIRVAVEEHGQGRQLVRFRVWPRWSWTAAAAVLVLAAAALLSATAGAWAAAAALGLIALWLLGRILAQAAASTVLPARAAERLAEAPDAAVVEAVRSVGEQPLIARSRA
jgi:hypothetical protein